MTVMSIALGSLLKRYFEFEAGDRKPPTSTAKTIEKWKIIPSADYDFDSLVSWINNPKHERLVQNLGQPSRPSDGIEIDDVSKYHIFA